MNNLIRFNNKLWDVDNVSTIVFTKVNSNTYKLDMIGDVHSLDNKTTLTNAQISSQLCTINMPLSINLSSDDYMEEFNDVVGKQYMCKVMQIPMTINLKVDSEENLITFTQK